MTSLPEQFRDLEAFVPLWAFASEDARSEKRWASSPADYDSFYAATIDRIGAIMAYLDQFPVNAIPEHARPLYHLALAFAEASPHVEMYKSSSKVPNSFDARRFVAAHGANPD